MLRWKVCGITNASDARAAVDAGADALGFVFWPGSPRCVSEDEAARIVAGLPDETWRIGVFVNAGRAELERAVERAGLDFLQLAGDESPEDCRSLPRHVIKSLRFDTRMTASAAEQRARDYSDCTLLIDAGWGREYGGTGRPANWKMAAVLAGQRRLFLAGGLTAENVGRAIETVRPWALDVSSGVESRPGRKDPGRLDAFARAIAEYR